MDNYGEIIIYQTEDGLTKLDVRMGDELDENSTCRKFRQVRMEGSRQVTRELTFNNHQFIKNN